MTGLALVLGLLVMAAPKAQAQQLYVSSLGYGPVGSFDPATGAPINSNFIPNTGGPQPSMVTDGNRLYLSDFGTFSVGVYDAITGSTITPSLTTGVQFPFNLALAGNNLYVSSFYYSDVAVYNATTGALINSSVIQTLSTGGMLASGNQLFVSENFSGTVGLYDALTGAVINASLITGVPLSYGMARSGNHLFLSHYNQGTVGVYDITTGATINASLISGLSSPGGVAVSGNNLYVANSGNNTVGVYDATTGATINASLISGDTPWGLLFFDNLAQISAETTGLAMANVEGQMLISAVSTVTNDINGHLFNLRAGDGEEDANDSVAALMDEGVIIGQGDGDPDAKSPIAKRVQRSRQWEVFTTVNYGNVRLNAINNQAGVQIDAWAPSVGIERHLSRGLAVGFATTFLTSEQNYTSGLGRLHLEGPAFSAYASSRVKTSGAACFTASALTSSTPRAIPALLLPRPLAPRVPTLMRCSTIPAGTSAFKTTRWSPGLSQASTTCMAV